ncbi:uncharacterized protein EI90DRAFT_166007 [Cantharellus anzutake]|uniref:uncharacterized protein n=1 Tax=Cantharellus anzutake TaxID=1750568 RepID=UPI001907FC58|nr:uncharacterized protein EI90DRAFT_166007 [Cantharellus anzutake]KAF8336361.1 hypothetical protein EI90DRAFT_166007 [Cantharellus anzutake]
MALQGPFSDPSSGLGGVSGFVEACPLPDSLPFDILTIIVSFVDSIHDLRNLACVNKGLRLEAERIIYASPLIRDAFSLEGFLESIVSRPERGSFAKSVSLALYGQDVHLRRPKRPVGNGFSISSLRSKIEGIYYSFQAWDGGLLSRALSLAPNLVEIDLKLPESDYSLANPESVLDRTPHSVPNSLSHYLTVMEKGAYYSSSLRPLNLYAPPRILEAPSMPNLARIRGDPEVIEALSPFRPVKDVTLLCLNHDPCGVASALRTMALSSGPVERLYMDAGPDGGFHLSFLGGVGGVLRSLRVLCISVASFSRGGESTTTVAGDIERGLVSLPNLEVFEIVRVNFRHGPTAELWLSVPQEWETREVGQEWHLQLPELGTVGSVCFNRIGSQ